MNKKNSGFTLIELLAVVSILAMLVILSMPNIIEAYNNSRKESFINEVRSLLNGAKQAYTTESIKDNWIVEVVSDNFTGVSDAFVMDTSGREEMEFYISLDDDGNPHRYVFTDGNYSVYSISGEDELSVDDILEATVDLNDYYEDFQISGPKIVTSTTSVYDAKMFNFRASDLIGAGPNGENLNTWQTISETDSGPVSITGTIYKYSGGSISAYTPSFTGGALNFPTDGKVAIKFNSMPYIFDSFTLEATIKIDKYDPQLFTNLISNVNSGGYYLVVDKNGHVGIGVYDTGRGDYTICLSKEIMPLNDPSVITGTFDATSKELKVYIDGHQVDVYERRTPNNVGSSCKIVGNLKYPTPIVPLAIGGNPNASSFDDREWFKGDMYIARIYEGLLSSEQIENNYYSNMITVNNYSPNSTVLVLRPMVAQTDAKRVLKYQYSLDKGVTWIDYNEDDKPIIYENAWVYARVVSKLGVYSPATKEYIQIN